MSLKNSITTSDYLDFNSTLNKALEIIKNDKNYKLGFLIIVGINTELKISDILKIKHIDLKNRSILYKNSETNERRVTPFNDNIMSAYELFLERNIQSNEYVFTSNQNKVYSIQYVNRELKKMLGTNNLAITSHSLRKTFGRNFYFKNYESDGAVSYLSYLFKHSSLAITKRYLCIRQEKLDDI